MGVFNKERFRQRLNECVELAEKYGLSEMTMDEISEEVEAVRKEMKKRNSAKNE